jgi:hypothetical protein
VAINIISVCACCRAGARLERRHREPVFPTTESRRIHHRNPNVGIVLEKPEARRQDSDDRPQSGGANGLLERARVAAEAALPVGIADHSGPGSTPPHLLRREEPAGNRLDPKTRKNYELTDAIRAYSPTLPRTTESSREE